MKAARAFLANKSRPMARKARPSATNRVLLAHHAFQLAQLRPPLIGVSFDLSRSLAPSHPVFMREGLRAPGLALRARRSVVAHRRREVLQPKPRFRRQPRIRALWCGADFLGEMSMGMTAFRPG